MCVVVFRRGLFNSNLVILNSNKNLFPQEVISSSDILDLARDMAELARIEREDETCQVLILEEDEGIDKYFSNWGIAVQRGYNVTPATTPASSFIRSVCCLLISLYNLFFLGVKQEEF